MAQRDRSVAQEAKVGEGVADLAGAEGKVGAPFRLGRLLGPQSTMNSLAPLGLTERCAPSPSATW